LSHSFFFFFLPKVRALLHVLTAKVNGNREALNAQFISMALYGLQSMTSEMPEVRAMLRALTAKVRKSKEALRCCLFLLFSWASYLSLLSL
jgi:hypothetical protein